MKLKTTIVLFSGIRVDIRGVTEIYPMLVWCWTSVYDAGPALNQHWVTISFSLDVDAAPGSPRLIPVCPHSQDVVDFAAVFWPQTSLPRLISPLILFYISDLLRLEPNQWSSSFLYNAYDTLPAICLKRPNLTKDTMWKPIRINISTIHSRSNSMCIMIFNRDFSRWSCSTKRKLTRLIWVSLLSWFIQDVLLILVSLPYTSSRNLCGRGPLCALIAYPLFFLQ